VSNQSAVSSPTISNPRTSSPTSRYDHFLFARICEEANGTPLTVLSAFARLDVDPWEEATRLATMSKTAAKTALVSILDLIPGERWKQSEADGIASRLIRLLPEERDVPTAAVTSEKFGGLQSNFWLVWMVLAIVMSLIMPRSQEAAKNLQAADTKSDSAGPLKDAGVKTTSSAASDRAHQ